MKHVASLPIFALGFCLAASSGAGPPPTPQAKKLQAANIHVAVFSHLTQDAFKEEQAADYRFTFYLLVPPNQESIRLVAKVNSEQDAEQQFEECHSGKPSKAVKVNCRITENLSRVVSAQVRKRVNRERPKPEGNIRFYMGQIRWDGNDRAIAQAGFQYQFYNKKDGDNGAGAAMGWSYRLQKVGTSWRVIGRKPTMVAG